MTNDALSNGQSAMDGLRLAVDSFSLDPSTLKRKLKSIEQDGTLTYEDQKAPEAKLTETLSRIWAEYPGGMLDITESAFEGKDPGAAAVPEAKDRPKEEQSAGSGNTMSLEEMSNLRMGVLDQLNASRNELWYTLELAKTLKLSSSFTNTPPPATTLPDYGGKKAKAKPATTTTASSASATAVSEDPPVLPPGTFSTTPASIPRKSLAAQVKELELALAAKQAALEECGQMIDSAVEELTTMANAGDQFWTDVRRLKEGRHGRGQWALVPKPDFGGTMRAGERAKDIIIPYALDEASAGTRARCLAAFDLDPAKKELAFGARSHLRLRITLTDANGLVTTSSPPTTLSGDADVGSRMEEAQLEAFDEELFAEIRAEILRRGSGLVEPRSVSFEIGDQKLAFELTETSKWSTSSETSSICDLMLIGARMNLLQTLRTRKRRMITPAPDTARPTSILGPLAQILQYYRLSTQVRRSLELLERILTSAGIESSLCVRMSIDSPDVVVKYLEEPTSIDVLGGLFTLEIAESRGLNVSTSAPSSMALTTSKGIFPLLDLADLTPVLSEDVALQVLHLSLPLVKAAAAAESARDIFLDTMEEVISIPKIGRLRLSIPAPYDSLQGDILGSETPRYDSRNGQKLHDWIKQAVVVREDSMELAD